MLCRGAKRQQDTQFGQQSWRTRDEHVPPNRQPQHSRDDVADVEADRGDGCDRCERHVAVDQGKPTNACTMLRATAPCKLWESACSLRLGPDREVRGCFQPHSQTQAAVHDVMSAVVSQAAR